MADISDDDNDGHPGITAIPSSMDGNSLPATALSTSPPYAPQADKLYVVLRTELSLYGLATGCKDISGTAKATLLQQSCDRLSRPRWGRLHTGAMGLRRPGLPGLRGRRLTIPASVQAPSFAPAGITGTFNAKVLSNDPNGGGVDCAAVRAALP